MATTHTTIVVSQVNALHSYVKGLHPVVIDGQSLEIAAVTAVSRYGVIPQLNRSGAVKYKVDRAAEVIQEVLNREGGSLYGVTTGVGASAFTRTREVDQLQRALVNKNLNGILPSLSTFLDKPQLNLILPEDFMRGTVMVRLNTLIKGHSGVRWVVIDKMFKLLEEDIVPCAAKNNTVSASGQQLNPKRYAAITTNLHMAGDLGTLSYIAGTLLGLEDLHVWHGKGSQRKIQKASDVLKKVNLEPITYGPKEAIAILNGTAASSSAAAQIVYDANVLLLASQCVSVLTIEALRANLEPFEPFPHVVARPHPGQIEVASNIARMTKGSKLAFVEYPEGDPEFKLRQDRYHIRCVPQWVGPFAENLICATKQVDIELNSTTDNPIVDPDGQFPHNLYHAGNFQALAVGDAMDKVRHALQGIGKMLFAQHTEILNPLLNRGLPPDCAAGEPNLDYGLKSSDLACAAYVSELGFLAGSFLPHVHSTEHHNQSINSMALASARHARNSVELLQQLISTHLYTVCQAVDLREMNLRYLSKLRMLFSIELPGILTSSDNCVPPEVESDLFKTLRVRFGETTTLVSEERFNVMLSPLVYELYQKASTSPALQLHASLSPLDWVKSLTTKAKDLFLENRLEYFSCGTAYESLGVAGKVIYKFVREELDVPMRKGFPGMDKHEIGSGISEIFEAIRSGRMDTVWRDAAVCREEV